MRGEAASSPSARDQMAKRSSYFFPQMPADGIPYSVIALGPITPPSGRSDEASCIVSLAPTNWAKLPSAEVSSISVGVGSLTATTLGSRWVKGALSREEGTIKEVRIFAEDSLQSRSMPVTAPFIPNKGNWQRPPHPIGKAVITQVFEVEAEGFDDDAGDRQPLLIPALPYVLTFFTPSSNWARHLLESHWHAEQEPRRRVFDMPEFARFDECLDLGDASTRRVNAYRALEEIDVKAITRILSSRHALLSYRRIGIQLREGGYLKQAISPKFQWPAGRVSRARLEFEWIAVVENGKTRKIKIATKLHALAINHGIATVIVQERGADRAGNVADEKANPALRTINAGPAQEMAIRQEPAGARNARMLFEVMDAFYDNPVAIITEKGEPYHASRKRSQSLQTARESSEGSTASILPGAGNIAPVGFESDNPMPDDPIRVREPHLESVRTAIRKCAHERGIQCEFPQPNYGGGVQDGLYRFPRNNGPEKFTFSRIKNAGGIARCALIAHLHGKDQSVYIFASERHPSEPHPPRRAIGLIKTSGRLSDSEIARILEQWARSDGVWRGMKHDRPFATLNNEAPDEAGSLEKRLGELIDARRIWRVV